AALRRGREQERRGVEVLRPRARGVPDLAEARDDAFGLLQDAVEQVDDHRQDHREQHNVADPPEGHCGLLSATIAALEAMPGSAPRMMSNWALIALTAGS